MDIVELNKQIPPQDDSAMESARAHWNAIAKPLGSLGLLEDVVVSLAGLCGTADVRIDKRAVLVLCADNGVLAQGVAQTTADVTSTMADVISRGCSTVGCMARAANADVIAVDMGMLHPITGNILNRRIASGTHDISCGPAMTRDQAEQAILTGIDLVRCCKQQGYNMLATGEMGIGNTTTSSAIAAVLLGLPVNEVTGRGAGLSDDGLMRKISAIQRAIAINRPDPSDALDVLHKLGGFDIAGLAGVFIGGALYRVPILIDGFISAVSALIARRLCTNCGHAMFATHVSAEPAARMALCALSLSPLISANMRLGEGTGAVCALPLIDMALCVYHDMHTFNDVGIAAYELQQKEGKSR
ncbi:MAG: nicotinate-nucleotide--dimethylbenzimidazole phosphoribosyltransferase [Clostridia bacterium]